MVGRITHFYHPLTNYKPCVKSYVNLYQGLLHIVGFHTRSISFVKNPNDDTALVTLCGFV